MLHYMATSNPRITVTLTPAASAILRELAHCNGSSQSSIVGELVEMSVPVFERLVIALRAASTIQSGAKAEIAAGLERAQGKAEAQMAAMLGEMDVATRPLLEQAEKVNRRRKSAARTTPLPLTGGSGPRKSLKTLKQGFFKKKGSRG